jgi:hypothetical protein
MLSRTKTIILSFITDPPQAEQRTKRKMGIMQITPIHNPPIIAAGDHFSDSKLFLIFSISWAIALSTMAGNRSSTRRVTTAST